MKTKKNLERVKSELSDLMVEYSTILDRFRYVTLFGMKTRVPLHRINGG